MQGWLVIYPWRIKLIHARLIFSEERSANSAVGFDMCPTLAITRPYELLLTQADLERVG
jgi:hypothetical protein